MTIKNAAFIIFGFIITSFPLSSYCQTDSSSAFNEKYFFDDNGLSNAKNIFKLNIASAIIGDLSLQYERKLSRRIGIEASVGALLPYYFPENDVLLLKGEPIVNPGLGYSYRLFPKYYLMADAPEGQYNGFLWRRRFYHLDGGNRMTFTDLTFQSGYQFSLSDRLLLDVNLGIGFRFRRYKSFSDPDQDNIDHSLVMPLSLSIGYKF